jgi:hypothetical protein
MKDEQFKDNIFYHQTSADFKKNTNAALLICCAQVQNIKNVDDFIQQISR